MSIGLISVAAAAALAEAPRLADMRWSHRVLLVAAAKDDPQLARQRAIFAGMAAAAGERDLVLVTIVGDRVTGAGDDARTLRRRFGLPEDGFVAVLVGKDGGEKYRSRAAVEPEMLVATIDAMPMRRDGVR